jgi:hypothetical protein
MQKNVLLFSTTGGTKPMKIQKWVKFEDEIDIELNAEDVSVIFADPKTDIREWLYQMNSIATFLKGTPEEVLNQLNEKQKEVIGKFLIENGEKIMSIVSPATDPPPNP